MNIVSTMTLGAKLQSSEQDTVKQEPMLHRASRGFAIRHGGPLTLRFIDALDAVWHDEILIDSRVHMLMPGMWPCIPGWHHDDVPRSRSDGQPNYDSPEYKSQHCMALWGDCSLTEFAIGETDFDIPPEGAKIYKALEPVVERRCNEGVLTRVTAEPCRLIFFDWLTWHRGMPTTHRGFRFFIRATRASGLNPRNEIRYNANVYMPIMEEGW